MMNPIIALKMTELEVEAAALQAVLPVFAVKVALQVVQVVASTHLSQLAMQETEQSVAMIFPVRAVVFPDSQAVQAVAPAVAAAAGAAIQVPMAQGVQAAAAVAAE